MLSTKRVCKGYGDLLILKNINLEVSDQEIVSIVGASGAGKTTLLQVLGTLDKPDSGDVFIQGTNVLTLSPKQLAAFRNQQLGFVFQFHHLLPEFSAIENICMPAWIKGLSKKEATKKAESLLDLLQLRDRAQHKPMQLSGGEQQRVAIARALINEPAIVLADEPTGNLDSENSQAIFSLINSLRENLKQTFILVTHNEELADLCDRKYTLADGQITGND